MPLRHLLRTLLNNEKLIEKLSESYPIRRAAQLSAYFFHKGKEIGEDKLEKLRESDALNRVQNEAKQSMEKMQGRARANSFLVKFYENFKEEWGKQEKIMKEQQQMLKEKDRKKNGEQ